MTTLPYRLCAIDLDDTLLDDDHQISERNSRAVRAVMERGVIVVVASGRMYATTRPAVSRLGLTTPVICYNGAMVRLANDGETWLDETVPADTAANIRSYARANSLQLNYYLDDRVYTAAVTPWMELYQKRTSADFIVLGDDFEKKLAGTSPTKLVVVDAPEKIDVLLPVQRDHYAGQLYVTKSNAEYLEFLPLDANKGSALALVAERYGIPQAQTLAFGDSWNDVPMLQWAGMGIAVANAKPEVLAAANRVVGSNKEDGVGIALEEIFGF